MAIRNIVTSEDPILSKPCRTVEEFDDKLGQLIDDMFETLEKAKGLGLAAPQVGILKRVFVMDVGDGRVEAVNPVILKESGKQRYPVTEFSVGDPCLIMTSKTIDLSR